MKWLALIFMLVVSTAAWAEDVQLTSDFVLRKPNIGSKKYKLLKSEQDEVEHALKKQGRLLIHQKLKPAKNDYQHDWDRGTVEYSPEVRNYSFHKVLIPDGTVIRESNFTQKNPHTSAITGKSLTFIECNLINVELDPSWTVQSSNVAQVKRVVDRIEDADGKNKIVISQQVESGGSFREVAKDEEIVSPAELDYQLSKFNA